MADLFDLHSQQSRYGQVYVWYNDNKHENPYMIVGKDNIGYLIKDKNGRTSHPAYNDIDRSDYAGRLYKRIK